MTKDILALLGLSATSTAYAVLLNTEQGRKFADEYAWASVVTGTGLVLFFLRLIIPREHWLKVLAAFSAAGIPMVMRSLLNKQERELQENK